MKHQVAQTDDADHSRCEPAERPGALEAAYVGAVIRNPKWLAAWSVPPAWISTHEPRRAYRAVRTLAEKGAAVSVEAVAAQTGLSPGVLASFGWDADVPRMWRRLRERAARRSLHLLGEALHRAADDGGADLAAVAGRVSELLERLAEAAA